jgi:preprotein translocase subunit SecF
MNDIDYLKILKWVVIVLLAGFIGQFGKSLAKHLMSRAKMRKSKSPNGSEITTVPKTTDHELKESAISQPEIQPVGSIREEVVTKADQDSGLAKEEAKKKKKELKALTKQQKKEAKLLKKEK